MNNYEDIYGRLHHKPVTEQNPIPSNNAFLYTAYGVAVGLPFGEPLFQCFRECTQRQEETGAFFFTRHPYGVKNHDSVPFSRDEVLGCVALGLIKSKHLLGKWNSWNFSPYPLPKFSALKLLNQLYELRPSLVKTYRDTIPPVPKYSLEFKHRNYFWQQNLDQIYRFAFQVPLVDRDFILNSWGKFQWYNPAHLFYKALSFADSKTGKSSGIRFLKYGGEKNKLAMIEEFPADHPITLAVNARP